MTDLDARVAEKVMGCKMQQAKDLTTVKPISMWVNEHGAEISADWFLPSTDIAAAWLVVEKMRERGYRFRLHNQFSDMEAVFTLPRMITEDKHWARSTRDSMPEAICRAALAAMGET